MKATNSSGTITVVMRRRVTGDYEGDLKTLDALLPVIAGERRTLAKIIFSRMQSGTTVIWEIEHDPAAGLNPKAVELYTKVSVLTRCESGPLPNTFTIQPSVPAWACTVAYQAGKLDTSGMACRRHADIRFTDPAVTSFLEGVHLDAIREGIRLTREGARKNKSNRKLNAIVSPLLNLGRTLQEAAIIASGLAKVKVPLLHSAAVLIRLANMDYSSLNSLFICVLLDKKHALPYKIIDALVFHSIRLSKTYMARRAGDAEKLSVL
ncbi:hypothetical protein FOMPIDRAFT_1047087 [Fomitopsis schrenkii]|uniref:Uncharacterized protein n=1 Tax=Fomitopsis schrenkii TaxID=2126942 RepID=S8FP90_FOMSC|nr:hypothetical protein FOMPIDRAFT_1047087 [Fomitopsis schrenkii]